MLDLDHPAYQAVETRLRECEDAGLELQDAIDSGDEPRRRKAKIRVDRAEREFDLAIARWNNVKWSQLRRALQFWKRPLPRPQTQSW